MRQECQERFPRQRWRVSDPDMHHGTCIRHAPCCMPGSLTSGILWSQWREKRSRHCHRMLKPQFCVSGKRPMTISAPVRLSWRIWSNWHPRTANITITKKQKTKPCINMENYNGYGVNTQISNAFLRWATTVWLIFVLCSILSREILSLSLRNKGNITMISLIVFSIKFWFDTEVYHC